VPKPLPHSPPDAPVFRVVLPAPTRPSASRSSSRTRSAPAAQGESARIREEPITRDRFPRELPAHRAQSYSPTWRGKYWPTAGAPPASRSLAGAAALRLSMSLPAAHPICRFVLPATCEAGSRERTRRMRLPRPGPRGDAFWTPVLEGDRRRSRCTAAGASFDGLELALGRFASRHRGRHPAPRGREERRGHWQRGQLQHRLHVRCAVGRAVAGRRCRRQARLQRTQRLHVRLLRDDAERLDHVVRALPLQRGTLLHRCPHRINGQRLLVLQRDLVRKPRRTPYELQTGGAMLLHAARISTGRCFASISPSDRSAVLGVARRAVPTVRQPLRCTMRAETCSCSARARCPATTRSTMAPASCRCSGARARPRPVRRAAAVHVPAVKRLLRAAWRLFGATRRAATAPGSITTRGSTTCCR